MVCIFTRIKQAQASIDAFAWPTSIDFGFWDLEYALEEQVGMQSAQHILN